MLYRLAAAWLLLLLAYALLTPGLAPYWGLNSTTIHAQHVAVPPLSLPFLFGTDDLGRDLFSRCAIGAQISLSIGLLTAAFSMLVGGAVGISAALLGGWVDSFLLRAIDVLYSLPGLMLVILLAVFVEPFLAALSPWLPILSTPSLTHVISVVLALSLFSWPDTARMVRAQTLTLKQEPFIEAFTCLGGGFSRLVLKQLLPNLWPILLLSGLLALPRAILTESTLSFIGLGVQPPLSSWGTLAADGWALVRLAPHLLLVPSVLLVGTMVAFNLLGEALKKRLSVGHTVSL
jgi:oligopeptide transport system permease protein